MDPPPIERLLLATPFPQEPGRRPGHAGSVMDPTAQAYLAACLSECSALTDTRVAASTLQASATSARAVSDVLHHDLRPVLLSL
jgi:hypothetical protein